jgi:hypothetical protein
VAAETVNQFQDTFKDLYKLFMVCILLHLELDIC